jgi:hypothetical protein
MIHLDVREGRVMVNDIASIHDRSSKDYRASGVEVGRRRDTKRQAALLRQKKKLPWLKDMSGLQLARGAQRESYRGIKI